MSSQMMMPDNTPDGFLAHQLQFGLVAVLHDTPALAVHQHVVADLDQRLNFTGRPHHGRPYGDDLELRVVGPGLLRHSDTAGRRAVHGFAANLV